MRIDFDQSHAGGLPPWLPSPDAGLDAIARIERDAREAARARIAAAPNPRCVTVITTDDPARKVFAIDPATGSLIKSAAARINTGVATTCFIESLAGIVDLIRELSEAPNKFLVLGAWRGAPPFGAPFAIGAAWVTRMRPDALPRNKATVAQSVFLLLDFDAWGGMPEGWRAMDSDASVAFLDAVIPGISRCARAEWCSSSARVVREGSGGRRRVTHAVIEVSDARLVPALLAHVSRAIKRGPCGAPFTKRATDGTGRKVATEYRTVIDLKVWSPERPVFVAPPCVAAAPGYVVRAADPRLVNPEGGVLDLSWLEPVPAAVIAGRARDGWAEGAVPMEWADAAPPHESPERISTQPKRGAVPRTMPDLRLVVVGARNQTMFDFARFKAYAWADQHGTAKVPFGLVLSWCREAVAGMRCNAEETSKQAVATARSITDWMPANYEPGVGVRSAPRTEAEKHAARVAGRAQGAATQRSKTDAALEDAIKRLNEAGERVTATAVAGLAKVSIRTAAGRLARGRAAAHDHANMAHHHMYFVGALAPAASPAAAPPSAAPSPSPLRESIDPAFRGKIGPNCAPRATVDRAVDAAGGLSPSWAGDRGIGPARWPPPDPMASGLHRGWHEHMARLRAAGARVSP